MRPSGTHFHKRVRPSVRLFVYYASAKPYSRLFLATVRSLTGSNDERSCIERLLLSIYVTCLAPNSIHAYRSGLLRFLPSLELQLFWQGSHPVIWGEIKPRGLLGVARGLTPEKPQVNPKQPMLGVCLGLLEVYSGLLGVAWGCIVRNNDKW